MNNLNIEIDDYTQDIENSLHMKCLTLLLNIEKKYLTSQNQKFFQNRLESIIRKFITNEEFSKESANILIDGIFHLIINKLISPSIISSLIERTLTNQNLDQIFENIKNLACILDDDIYIFKLRENIYFKYKIICKKCYKFNSCNCISSGNSKIDEFLDLLRNNDGVFISRKQNNQEIQKNQLEILFDTLSSDNVSSELISAIPCLLKHLNCFENDSIQEKILNLFSHQKIHIRIIFADQLPRIIEIILDQRIEIYEKLLEKYIKKLLECVRESLDTTNQQNQSRIINTILKFATVTNLPEKILLHLFRMTFMFFIRYESCVSYEAALCATEICSIHGVTPKNMLNWYKQDILKLIVSLSTSIFLRNGICFNNALSNITKMLGFIGPRDFISYHYKLIVAMLLPYCIQYPKSQGLLEEVANMIQKDLPTVLTASFLTTYPHLFLNESAEINNKCIDFIIQNTGSSLYKLLHSDIKRTVAEILIYYHKNPTSVMQAFRSLLLNDIQTGEITHSIIADYIATRFLGVLTFFESCLIDPDFEKSLKIETLLSLGDIIRFLGTNHITPFRFKILAVLRTALTVNDKNLRNISSQIWNIFIHTVDIQTLGPLLSTIVTSLQPLLKTHTKEINSIYKFLIITNGSLLSLHISDLYFMEKISVNKEIKNFIINHTEKLRKGDNFMEKFQFFLNQIRHENVTVRIYGLKYLSKLFRENRTNLNNLIIGQNNQNSILENVLDTLMAGCRHIDENLQLESGKCLGELTAIEPSHLAPNYSPERDFALSIHTDSFAIMALKELCRAYQFQRDTKYVDSFSLGIQEILLARGVSPKLRKKLEVWEAIPERMRQLMEPLLTSCYTGVKMNNNIKVHPIFGSSKCQTCDEWAFIWASKMIEKVQDEETQHLLNSFKPSIKRDTNILGLFLPYIILHALQSSSGDDCDKIYEELLYVFEAAVNKDAANTIDFNKERMRGIKTIQFVPIIKRNKFEEPTEYISIKCAKLGFEQLDFLEHWLRERRRMCNVAGMLNETDLKVEKFLKRFDKLIIAKANFYCGEYARSLMYIESFIENNKKELQNNLSFLAEIYAELMDPDSLEGAINLKRTELTLSEQILVNNMTDRLLESTACFERLMQAGEILPTHVRDVVQCYLRLNTPETALLVSEGLLNQLGEKYMDDCLKEIQAEPLWRLGRFEDLEKLLNDPLLNDSSNWGVQCGQALLYFRKTNITEFNMKIEKIYLNVLKLLRTGGVEQNSYQKGYPHVMKLHLIDEIVKAKILSDDLLIIDNETNCKKLLKEFFKEWNLRLTLLQPTPRITESVLCLRRILLNEIKEIFQKKDNLTKTTSLKQILNEEIGKMWIQSAELARTAGMFQQSQICIMSAEEYQPENLFLEKAKLFWKKGDQTNCFKVIEHKIKDLLELSEIENLPISKRLLYAEAKFLQATYNAESMNISTDLNVKYFKESLNGNSNSEKCLVHFAQYLEKIHTSITDDVQSREYLLEIMACYGKSMNYGCEYIYQSMPRTLTIWLDFTAQMKTDEHFKRVASKMNDIIEKFTKMLPLFIFFTAFSQLISRICHPSAEVYTVLKTIIVCLIQKYPQQSLWMILSVFKSSYASRVKRCTEIFNDKRLANVQMQKLIIDFNSLAEKLIELTNKEIPPKQKNPTVSSLVRYLPKLFIDKDFSQIVMPYEQFMQPILPPINERNSPANIFDAFPNKCVYINGIQEEITVLTSLQRPRKVTLIGNNGKLYAVMMKPKDDLRKDFRLMEFNAVVKQYLHQDSDARQRRLKIRTYAVLPLNEECGLIEWVQNLETFRHILIGIYNQRSLGMNIRKIRDISGGPHVPIEKKREIFLKTILPKYPPVFGEWFRHRFTTPHNWYQARSSYVRTTAVMSMVGYILGLGDRHGENILLDAATGDAVHVDFNCLFNKGESFEFPEKVPFRLTHNMVHAMGPLGIEGLYRKCCEITMRVLQEQKTTLMAVLRPFVYDPLVTWSKSYRGEGHTERTDPLAMKNVKHIEERLKGFVKIKGQTSKMPLSTEGQVNFIIMEAINIDNLASMYAGWSGFM